MKHIITRLCLCFLFLSNTGFSQNDTKKWYFGLNAGLDFMTTPPTVLTGAMVTQEGSASVADANGSLLFYTDGSSVWTQAHTIMANGTGLFGNTSTTQSAIIVKQPGVNTIYYLFTLGALGTGSLHVSTIDMSLSAGQGSVTTKNTLIYGPALEKLTAVRHCNGTDVWVTVHDVSVNNFRSFLVTSSGINTSAVVSAIGSANAGLVGYMKFSPNGKKIAYGSYNTNVEVFDFDASTGVVSNSLTISAPTAYGVEFSPDGTKLYASSPSKIYQWDLCAGNNTAVVASQYTMAATFNNALQLAANGKIYVARYQQQTLGVIANPDIAGSGCNYNDLGQSIAPNSCNLGLPNFICSALKSPPAPFTHTVSNMFGCQAASFTAPIGLSANNCAASGYSVNSMLWTFGDPASGAANTSTLSNPAHGFTNLGSYTVQLVLYYNCSSDTIRQPVFINQPCIAVSSTSITCMTAGSATVQATSGVGPFSYTWIPTAQNFSVATGLTPGTYTILVFDFGNNSTYSATTVFTPLIPLTGTLNKTTSLSCNGISTGTAAYTNIMGGSGFTNFNWTNGIVNYTSPLVSNLSAGTWSVQVTDALTGCTINNSFVITQPPALTLNIVAGLPTACVGNSITFTTSALGGTPNYTFTWPGAVQGNTFSSSQNTAGTYTYIVSSLDANNCIGSNQITAAFLPNPAPVIISNSPICSGNSLTISISGAATATWSGPLVNNATFSTYYQLAADQSMAGVYTATATAINGCTASTSHSVTINQTPALTVAGSTVCSNQTLSLTANAPSAIGYMWTGPNNFASTLPNILITNPNVNLSGTYTVLATSINGCTNIATVQASITAMPAPVLSLSSSSICAQSSGGSPFVLTATVSGASDYTYTIPPQFNNYYPQGPVNSISLLPPYTQTGAATITLTAANGNCTSSLTAVFNVVPNPTVTISVPQATICAGQLFTLTSSGATTYSWISGNGAEGFSAINGSLAIVNPISTMVYGVTGFSLGCYSSMLQSIIYVNPLPLVTILGSTLVCSGQSTTLTASTTGNTFTWSGGGTNSVVVVNPPVTSVYSVTVSNPGGCSNTAAITITASACTGIESHAVDNAILIYPNPAQDFIYVRTIAEGPHHIEITDNIGRIVLSADHIENYYNAINIGDLANGIYYLHYKDKTLKKTKPFVIAR